MTRSQNTSPASAARALALATIAVVLVGCVHAPLNARLVRHDAAVGYRFGNLTGGRQADGPFVFLALSGGGTRAAAFSFGLLEALRDVIYTGGDGAPRRLLDDVEVLSSVSGGSFTAAYYAAFRDAAFDKFPEAFLYRDVQSTLIRRALSPLNWARLASPYFSRIDLAAELYDEIFEGKTFGDLLAIGRKPFLLLNATDMTLGERFAFTQEQFDLLCSDLLAEKLARGVAASSAFPVLLTALTLRNYADAGCEYHSLQREAARERDSRRSPHARKAAERAASYYTMARERRFIHLLDGGITDNLGLRGLLPEATEPRSPLNLWPQINRGELRRVFVITANAMANHRNFDWDHRWQPPGIPAVLGFVTSWPVEARSLDTVQFVNLFVERFRDEQRTQDAVSALLRQSVPAAPFPAVFPLPEFHTVELSFDAVEDDRLRRCLSEIPTSFGLAAAQVTLLRHTAHQLLLASPDFRAAMATIAPGWIPAGGPIDAALIAEACGDSSVER